MADLAGLCGGEPLLLGALAKFGRRTPAVPYAGVGTGHQKGHHPLPIFLFVAVCFKYHLPLSRVLFQRVVQGTLPAYPVGQPRLIAR